MEKIEKYWGFLALIIGSVVGVFGWFYNKGAESNSLEGRTFDTPEQKVQHIQHVSGSLTPEQQQRAHLLDSFNKIEAIKSRRKRDSLWLQEYKARMKTDSINQLNADQLFQIKEELKQIKSQR